MVNDIIFLYIVLPIIIFVINVLRKSIKTIIINIILIGISIIAEMYFSFLYLDNEIIKKLNISFYSAVYIISIVRLIYLKIKKEKIDDDIALLWILGFLLLIPVILSNIFEYSHMKTSTYDAMNMNIRIWFINIPTINYFIAVCTGNKEKKIEGGQNDKINN